MTLLSQMFGKRPMTLNEAVNHGDMFNDMAKIAGSLPQEVQAVLTESRRVLKNRDRVTWFLRLWKVGYVKRFVEQCERKGLPVPADYAKRVIADYARKAKMSEEEALTEGWTVFRDKSTLINFEHFFSLPIPAIQKVVFNWSSPDEIFGKFHVAEEAWKAETKDAFEDDDIEEIMKFPNGLAWFNLNRQKCDLEGDAMGHCGNGGSSNGNETILSLRKVFVRGDKTLYEPHLTFILDHNGMIGEMKGRGNEKPAQKYHNEIVALLRSPLIHGIKGGGYLPQNNFSLSDLDEETREQLIEEKPELAGLFVMYQMYGIEDPRVMDLLHEKMSDENVQSDMLQLSDDRRVFTLDKWDDFSKFVAGIDDDIVEGIDDIITGQSVDYASVEKLSRDQIADIIDHLSTAEYATLMGMLNVRVLPENHPRIAQANTLAAERLSKSKMYDDLIAAANVATGMTPAVKDELIAQRAKYIDVGWYFRGMHQYVNIDENNLDEPVYLRIGVRDLMALFDSDDNEDGDGYLLHDIREHGWHGMEDDHMSERRKEEGLSGKIGYAKENDDPVVKKLGVNGAYDPYAVGRDFMKRITTPQTEPDHPRFDGI